MQYIRGLEHYDNARKTAVTFGKFDGLHKGHMTLVDTVKKLQDKDDVDSVVCAFDMDSPALLMLPQERQIHLEDEVEIRLLGRAISKLSPREQTIIKLRFGLGRREGTSGFS